MPILENRFKCANGHEFIANAKIRARCPECGEKSSRVFSSTEPPNEGNADNPDPEKKPKPGITKPVLLRRGKPREMPIKKQPAKVAAKPKPKVTTKPAITKPVARASNGLVKSTRITRKGVTPTVRKPPAKTAVARHIKEGAPKRSGSFLDDVISRFGPR
jgi:outer membrane biosynthesis protein TonB